MLVAKSNAVTVLAPVPGRSRVAPAQVSLAATLVSLPTLLDARVGSLAISAPSEPKAPSFIAVAAKSMVVLPAAGAATPGTKVMSSK